MARAVQAGALDAFSSDFSIWKNKRSAIRVLQQPKDGPFGKGRRWYQQFYDLADKAGEYHQELNGVLHIKDFASPDDNIRQFEEGLFVERA